MVGDFRSSFLGGVSHGYAEAGHAVIDVLIHVAQNPQSTNASPSTPTSPSSVSSANLRTQALQPNIVRLYLATRSTDTDLVTASSRTLHTGPTHGTEDFYA
jgi:hypothetical protein